MQSVQNIMLQSVQGTNLGRGAVTLKLFIDYTFETSLSILISIVMFIFC